MVEPFYGRVERGSPILGGTKEEILVDWITCHAGTQFCGPFRIIERIGPIAFQLALPLTAKVYDVFHVSLVKKYVKDVDHVIDWFVLQVYPEGEFQPEPQ